ncbi:hypothetical protein OR571_17440 [Psychrobacillus sp. NEAU-3TGS]|uniref:hypothetical protein n=1 Tax=Psychrobacillus sp. NEAU-3TGS TaxID=2995412 RepID=UPI00249763A7|nr:hypothetical protein [Psychrobacillus sp. NEAU-3TGS]MDI2588835.1 hypothetical protein [Psychrobacillus sp. NEAU-3TGS]
MDKNKRSNFWVAFTNTVILCLAQIIYWTILAEIMDTLVFQFLVFPLIIVLINTILWFSTFKLKFYQHALFVYGAFFVSVIVSSFLLLVVLDHQELPPGEVVLFTDVLFIFITVSVQLLILMLLNFIMYIFYRVFT